MGTQVLQGPGPVNPLGWQLLALHSVPALCEVPTGWSSSQGSGLGVKECLFGGGGVDGLLWC